MIDGSDKFLSNQQVITSNTTTLDSTTSDLLMSYQNGIKTHVLRVCTHTHGHTLHKHRHANALQ